MASAVEVILIEDSQAGKAGELRKVRLGYARNFLLPRGLAVVADSYQMAAYAERKAELERRAEEKRQNAEAHRARLGDSPSISVHVTAGVSGKLFGAITKERVADEVFKEFQIEIDKSDVQIKSPIKTVGEYTVTLNLGSGISTELILKVST